jgi:hypothetical protein
MGMSEATFYNCKKKGGLGVSEFRSLKSLKEENFQLKKLLADSLLLANSIYGKTAESALS